MTTRAIELAKEIDEAVTDLVAADRQVRVALGERDGCQRNLTRLLDEVRALKLAPTPDGEPEAGSSARLHGEALRVALAKVPR